MGVTAVRVQKENEDEMGNWSALIPERQEEPGKPECPESPVRSCMSYNVRDAR